ncbi:hypothetical protein [Streptomyces sp. Da 82-17]|uniref:hypothetical protein n=1 Tax=Streptomyces sp. Da 82-17 TaxID=3377116 RepID=UPI0038D3A990
MNTTAAALEAHVTADTIRTWCRRGVIAAIKQAGRWIIDSASLARRITIGQRKARMTEQPKYRLEEGVKEQYGVQRTIWTVVRTDGTPAGYGAEKDHRIHGLTFLNRELAEIHLKFLESTPAGFKLERKSYSSRNMKSGYYWEVAGSTEDDPQDMRHTWDEGQEVSGNWPEGTTWLDVLISLANRHAGGADKRIAAKAEKDAIEAAEAAAREAREEQLGELRRNKGELATPRQVDYILQLLDQRAFSGEGGGFFYGPTDRAGIEELSKSEASSYIDSLKGNY